MTVCSRCAVVIIVGSVLLVRVRAEPQQQQQSVGRLELTHLAVPSDAVVSSLHLLRSAVAPLMQGMRRSSYISAVDGAEFAHDGDDAIRIGEARERKRTVPLEEV